MTIPARRRTEAPAARRRTASPPAAGRTPARRGAVDAGSRERLLTAAAGEFAARGFAGANVDRIARAARVNKAMIYYHFSSKAALYREIVGDMFQAVGARLRSVAEADVPPEDKMAAFVEAIASEAEARPHFPPIWLREVAEGGTHLDDATLKAIAGILKTLVLIMQSGVAAGRFQPAHPFMVHGGIVAPLMLFFASGGLRKRLERAGVPRIAEVTRDEVVAHVQAVTLGVLKGTMR